MMAEITAREASARFNVSVAHLGRLARAGTFPKARQFVGAWLFDEDELTVWANDKTKHRRGGKREGAGRKPKAGEA